MKFKSTPQIITTKNGMVFANIEIPKPYVDELNKVLKHNDITVEIYKTKKPRSLTSNAYCWVLLSKLAVVAKSTDEEVYIQMLERYGPRDIIAAPLESEPILKKAYKVVRVINECTINNTKAVTFKLIRGSSTYDQSEMNHFIEGIISECKLLNIEVLPPKEVARLIEMMEG